METYIKTGIITEFSVEKSLRKTYKQSPLGGGILIDID